MEFIKKNYEKVLLGVVLLGLTVAACLLPIIISAERQKLEDERNHGRAHATELTNVNMAVEDAAFQRAQAPMKLDFTTRHNLFNPVVWKKLADGRLLKEQTGKEEGPDALEVTNIRPLYLIVGYGYQSGSGYFFTIERQGELRESRRKTSSLVSKDSKTELLTLRDVKGPPEKPAELDLEWNPTGEPIVVTPEKPFKRVDGFAADLKYPLEVNKAWTDRRVGSPPLNFAGGYYNIVAITESNVVILDQSNKKKTTINLHSATETR